jgi:hypothetical protein
MSNSDHDSKCPPTNAMTQLNDETKYLQPLLMAQRAMPLRLGVAEDEIWRTKRFSLTSTNTSIQHFD